MKTILRLYHEGSGPASLVHEIDGEKHILDVIDIRAEHWFRIEIEAKRRDNEEKLIFTGHLGGTFYLHSKTKNPQF